MNKPKTIKSFAYRALMLTAMIPIMLFGILSYRDQMDAFSSEKSIKTEKTINMLEVSIDQFDAYNRGVVEVFADHPTVQAAVRGHIDEDEILGVILDYYQHFESIESIFIGTSDGNHYSRKKALVGLDYDPRVRPWYKGALLKPGEIFITESYENASEPGTYIISYSKAIQDPMSGDVKGVVGCDIKLPSINQILTEVNETERYSVLLTDRNGLIISTHNLGESFMSINIQDNANQIVTIGNKRYEVNSKFIPATGWNVVVLVPLSLNRVHVINAIRTTFVVMVVNLIIAGVITYLISDHITFYVERLMRQIKRIQIHEMNLAIETIDDAPAELNDIVLTLNKMIERINEQSKEINGQYMEIESLYEETVAMNDTLFEYIDKLELSHIETIKALSNTIEAKDTYTLGHCERVTYYALEIARKLGYTEDQLRMIERASLLHDIGKIGIPEEVLNKPGRLSESEYQLVKEHSEVGCRIVNSIQEFEDVALIIKQHHERYDGKGYPDGAMACGIAEGARIISVADAYDAMTSARAYRMTPLTPKAAKQELLKSSGSQFDPQMVELLISILDSETFEEKSV